MLLSQSLWNSLLGKGFISIKADKTSNDSLKNSPGISAAKQSGVCIYLSRRWETIKTKMIAHFEMQHRGIMRLQLLQEQNQTKCFFFHKWLLVLFTHIPPQKKGHRFQLMKQGIESEVLRDMD